RGRVAITFPPSSSMPGQKWKARGYRMGVLRTTSRAAEAVAAWVPGSPLRRACPGDDERKGASAHLQQALQIVALQLGAERIAEPAADFFEDAARALGVDLVRHLDRIAEIGT